MKNIKIILKYFIYLLIPIYLYYILYKFNITRFNSLYTDSAGYVDLIEGIKNGYGFNSPIFSSFFSYIPYLSLEPLKFCNEIFESVYKDSSYLNWHPYLLAYPLAFISEVLKINSIEMAGAINSINVVGSIFIIYWFLRHKKLGGLTSLLYCIFLLTSQIWVGMIYGQLYFDRLMLLPGILMVIALAGGFVFGRQRLIIVSASYLFCVLISERAALIASLTIIGYVFLSVRDENLKNKVLFIFISMMGILYLYYYKNFYQNNLYYDSITIASMINNFKDAFSIGSRISNLTLKWFIVLAPFIIISLFSKRYFIIVLGVLMPNLLVSVGGAEKTGFLTHYHAVYFPILIGFSTIAFGRLEKVKNKFIPVTITLLLITYNIIINIDNDKKIYSFNSFLEARRVFNKYTELMPNSELNNSFSINGNYLNGIASLIPKNSSVSSPEILMPALVKNGNRYVDYFPIGLGINDYVIVQKDLQSGMYAVTTYLDFGSSLKIQKCITDIVNAKYQKIEYPNPALNGTIEIHKLKK